MRSGEKRIFVLIAVMGLGWSELGRSAEYGAPELLNAVADTPGGSALKFPDGVTSSEVRAAFVALDRALTLVPLGGQAQTATLTAVDSLREKLTKRQMEGLQSLTDAFDQKLKSGEIEIDSTARFGLKPRLRGALAANEEPPCVDRGMTWHHPSGMSGNPMGREIWNIPDDGHRKRMGHQWWAWNASLTKWGAALYVSQSYLQLRCLNDDNMTETNSMPGWFAVIAATLPCPEKPVSRTCLQDGVLILWTNQYWLPK